ncbi:DUF4132 domain-containing protein [Ktedonobacteria bacterium brp13]|nr:DUF4132 domain-containing protein [Ktedonobacteria bacterium brp13]
MSEMIRQAQTLYKTFQDVIQDTSIKIKRTEPETFAAGQAILEVEPVLKIAFVQVVLQEWDTFTYVTAKLLSQLLRRTLPYTDEDVRTLLKSMVRIEQCHNTLRILTDASRTPISQHEHEDPTHLVEIHRTLEQLRSHLLAWHEPARYHDLLEEIENILRHNGPWYYTYAHLSELMRELLGLYRSCQLMPIQPLVRSLARPLRETHLLAECRPDLELLREYVSGWLPSADQRKFLMLLDTILNGQKVPMNPMQADDWSKPLFPVLEEMDEHLRSAWLALLRRCSTAAGTTPNQKWSTALPGLLAALRPEQFQALAIQWFRALTQNKGNRLHESNAVLLKGLAWCCTGQAHTSLAAALADAAIEGYRKLPGLGPRAAMVAGACLYTLQTIPTLDSAAQIERLRLNVKQPTYLKDIEQALDNVAHRTGMSREDLEELTVPTFAIQAGQVRHTFGSEVAEIKLEGLKVHVQWYDAAGKARKSASAEVKRLYKIELKELKHLCNDIEHMLLAQRDRLERLLLSERQWSLSEWRGRYLEHPLVGHLATHLLWRFTCEDQIIDAIYYEKQFINAEGQPQQLPHNAQVSLWHPIASSATEIQTWRLWLEAHQITQPFKQAHREIYILTAAERTTNSYSNRFAAHLLKQHQFHALAIARGWHNQLRLMVDDSYEPATLTLPRWNLRAEYWIEGAGEEYAVDTNEAGTYLRVATDQVRFYPLHAATNRAHATGGGYGASVHPGRTTLIEPLPLAEIPPLVFSEVMRDVDLFVGVASVGNDPTWQDGGPEGRYLDYWHNYSFGELSATANTRKQLLQRLLPQLAITNRCTLDDRFLIVRGDLRSYKIHLGSGNILMEPNDQYLCIVPDRSMRASSESIFLPFEDDTIFSLILSKAFLLAEDTQITDPTITHQIHL